MRALNTRITLLSAAVIAAATAMPAAAQSDEDSLQLEEVIVTARKREESLQDVPVSVTALSEELKQATVRDLRDIQDFVPNVSIETIPGNNGASVSIRGISFQETDKSLDPPAGIILDGVYMGIVAGQVLSNFDMERIEVLRGPQGTLFGKNTIAGALNVIRTAPTKEWGAKVKLGGGDWNRQEVQAVVNTPLSERGGLKLYAHDMEHDGYIENNIIGDDIGGADYLQYGASMAFDITDNFDLALTLERVEDDSDVGAWANFNKFSDFACFTTLGTPGFPTAPAPAGSGCGELDDESGKDNSSQNESNYSETTQDYANLTMNWMIGDWQLTSITGYVDREEDFRVEYDASRTPFLDVLGAHEYEQTSQELRLNGNIGDNINLTTGLYYWKSEYWQTQDSFDMWYYFGFDETSGFGPGDISQNLTGEGDNTAYALFASLDWALGEQWTLNLGGRFTYEEKTFTGRTGSYDHVPSGTAIIPEGPIRKMEDDWNEFSPRVALQYSLNDDMMIFGSFASGFKSGGFFARTQDIDNLNSYDPEYVDTYELGLKSEWWDNRLRLNATAFFSDYTDKQEDVIIANPSGEVGTVVTNASEVELYGLEVEMTAVLTSKLNVFFNLGLLESEYSDFDADLTGDGIVTDNSGLVIRNAPETTVGIGGNFIQPLNFGELAVNYNYRWRDGYQTIFQNDPLGEVESAGFHNASMDLLFLDNYRISVYGRNLTDERFARVILIPPVSNFGQWNEPRNYGVEFTMNF